MGIFDNYYVINESDYPDNIHFKAPVVEINTNYDTVTKEFDIRGRLIGFKWDYGTAISINFTINKYIYVAEDAILYTDTGVYPTVDTEGYVGQKCYNLTDIRSWTCTDIVNYESDFNTYVEYVWTMDDDVVSYSDDTKLVMLSPDMTGKSLKISFTNWMGDPVYEKSYEGTPIAAFVMDKTQSAEAFLKGNYVCIVSIVSDTDCIDVDRINFRVV